MGTPAIVLLSGGLDSATVLAIARAEGFDLYALSFRYGQRHSIELQAAEGVAHALGVRRHLILDLDLGAIGGSALTDAAIDVPKDRPAEEVSHGIPVTYVPARNTVFLSHALAWAEVLGCSDIFIGVNAVDYSVGGDSLVWIRSQSRTRLMTMEQIWNLPAGTYQTLAMDPATLQLGWHRVKERLRHRVAGKRCFCVRLERGQSLSITEDHSLFTVDPATGRPTTIRGSDLALGTPVVVPFDASAAKDAWSEELHAIDLSGLIAACRENKARWSIRVQDGQITNRLGKTRIPLQYPVTDEFLYILGLWLAEGGKELDSQESSLRFSIGGIPGAVETLRAYFGQFQVGLHKSPANRFDYWISSSVIAALFQYLGLFGTAKAGQKRFPGFFWNLSQRQRRLVVAGLWDGDGSHVFKGTASLAQKSHPIIDELYFCLLLDGIFPVLKFGKHSQKLLLLHKQRDFATLVALYPLRHEGKRSDYERLATKRGREQTTGLWKCPGLWQSVASASLEPGAKTRVYNCGGKYDRSFRAQRSAFRGIPGLQDLVDSRLAFLRVVEIQETSQTEMYDLSVEGAENFVANGVLAHNSGYPDCRPEFIEAFEHLANLATRAGVEGRKLRVHTPLIRLSKADIIRRGLELGVDYVWTHSCYDPDASGAACGRCDSCQLRLRAFQEVGIPDPIRYQS